MLGGLGEGGQLVLESLVWCPIADAASGCGVEPCGQALELVFGEFGQVTLARQEAADSTVGIFHGAFLPWAVRIAEVGRGSGCPGKKGMGGELGTAIEGDGPAASLRQPLPGSTDSSDEGVGLTIGVRQQHGVAGLALDHRGQVGLAVLTPEDKQIRFPMTEGPAIPDLGRPLLDRAIGWNEGSARFAAMAWAP